MSMTGYFLEINKEQFIKINENNAYAEELMYEPEEKGTEDRSLNIDKSWEGIHYLLTGRASNQIEETDIILGGKYIGEDLGYGPARLMTSEQVKINFEILKKITKEHLREKFNMKEMFSNKIYPPIWDAGEEAFEYLYRHFEELLEYYKIVSNNNNAMILCIV